MRRARTERLYLYVVTGVDNKYQPRISSVKKGMSAPNIVDNVITLGTCKPMIRTSLKKGFFQWDNYVIGLSPAHTNPRRALYVIRVKELITFSEAWWRGEEEKAYRLKKGGHSPLCDDPSTVRMNGDIIIKPERGSQYVHAGGVHKRDWNTYVIGGETVGSKRDIYVIGDRLASQYFWDEGPIFTERMFKRYWKGYPNMRGHRVLYGKEAGLFLGELDLR